MSNVIVKGLFQPEWFSECCGLFSSSLLRFSWMMVLWKEAKGMAVLDHTCKKIPFLRTIFVVVVEELKHFCFTFWASSAGPQSGAVVAACILHKM